MRLFQPIISSFGKTRNFALVRPKGTGKFLNLFYVPLETKVAAALLACTGTEESGDGYHCSQRFLLSLVWLVGRLKQGTASTEFVVSLSGGVEKGEMRTAPVSLTNKELQSEFTEGRLKKSACNALCSGRSIVNWLEFSFSCG